jgi:hypothetical protein
MFLERMMPEFGPLPETRRYRCSNCRYGIEEEIDREGRLITAIKFIGLAEWLGTRRVLNYRAGGSRHLVPDVTLTHPSRVPSAVDDSDDAAGGELKRNEARTSARTACT